MTGADRKDRSKVRLDQLLVLRGLAPTRSQAQALVLAGRVRSRGERLDKPGTRLHAETPISVAPGRRYVGRGGHKLAGALERFDLDVRDRDAIDVGASTGGFTQVLLEAGARRVIALDVGRGQLDWTLRNRAEVHLLEGKNARYLRPEDLPFPPQIAVIDVSFISVALVLPPVVTCLDPGWNVIALIKPQFEVGKGQVGRGGIVRDPEQHSSVIARTAGLAKRHGWTVRGIAPAALPGAQGNREYFIHLADRERAGGFDVDAAIDAAVREAARESEP